MVASLPVLVKRTTSADGTMRAEALCRFDFCRCRCREVRAFRHGFGSDGYQLRMRVSLDQCAEGHHEIHVLVAVGIPDVRTAAALQKEWATGVHGVPARRRVYSFDQGLLGAFKPLLGAGSRFGDLCHSLIQSAMPPPSTTRAAPVMNDESSEARNSTALAISSTVPILPNGRLAQPAR